MKGTGGRKRPIYISDDGLLRDPGGYYWRKVRGLRWSCERPEDAVRNCKTKTREKITSIAIVGRSRSINRLQSSQTTFGVLAS